jgi:hypothetical protein
MTAIAPPQIVTEGQCLDAAIALVRSVQNHKGLYGWEAPISAAGQAILERVSARLHARLDTYLFGSSPKIQSEQQALAYIKSAGITVWQGAEALLQAAEALKYVGQGQPANNAHRAYKALKALAEEMSGA